LVLVVAESADGLESLQRLGNGRPDEPLGDPPIWGGLQWLSSQTEREKDGSDAWRELHGSTVRPRQAVAEDHIKTRAVVFRAIGGIGGGHRRAMLPPDDLAPPVHRRGVHSD